MNPRKIRETLGRVKTCLQRRELQRAIQLLCQSLKDLGTQTAPTDLRGDFRTAITDIASDPEFKKASERPVLYQPGKEREILAFFSGLLNRMNGREEEEEAYETALQRKLNLDRRINDGKGFISQNKFTEADDSFAEAITFIRNEIAAYAIMARAMMEAGQYVRALGYVRKGLQRKPDNEELTKLGEECNRLRNNAQ